MGQEALRGQESAEAAAQAAKVEMDSAFQAGGGVEVKQTNERLNDADYKRKSFGFPKKTNLNQEDRDDLKFAKEQMPNPPEHYQRYEVQDGNRDTYAVVIYDGVSKSYTLFKSTLDADQVEEKWDAAKKGDEIYPNAAVQGYAEFLQQPEGTVKTVKDGDKTYVMARLRGGKSQDGVRMSEA